MQNRIRRHSFSYFVLLMKLSSLFVEWFLHIFPLLLLCSHRYWPEMCCIWPLGNASFSNIPGNQKLIYSKDYSEHVCETQINIRHILALHTPIMCVHILFSILVQGQPLGTPPPPHFLWSETFFDCLKGSQALHYHYSYLTTRRKSFRTACRWAYASWLSFNSFNESCARKY